MKPHYQQRHLSSWVGSWFLLRLGSTLKFVINYDNNLFISGYNCTIDFLTKPFYGNKKHKVTAEIFGPEEKKPFLTVSGEWNGVMEYKWSDKVLFFTIVLFEYLFNVRMYWVDHFNSKISSSQVHKNCLGSSVCTYYLTIFLSKKTPTLDTRFETSVKFKIQNDIT